MTVPWKRRGWTAGWKAAARWPHLPQMGLAGLYSTLEISELHLATSNQWDMLHKIHISTSLNKLKSSKNKNKTKITLAIGQPEASSPGWPHCGSWAHTCQLSGAPGLYAGPHPRGAASHAPSSTGWPGPPGCSNLTPTQTTKPNE